MKLQVRGGHPVSAKPYAMVNSEFPLAKERQGWMEEVKRSQSSVIQSP